MGVTYKKVTDLALADLPLSGAEYFPVVQNGTSKRALFSGIFGLGWAEPLKAAFSAFTAPEALHASQADEAAYAEEAETVNGLNFSSGPSSSPFGSRQIAAGAVFEPSAGTYIFFWNSGEAGAKETDFQIEAQDESTLWLGRARLGGLVITNGEWLRVRNTASSSRYLLWHKLA